MQGQIGNIFSEAENKPERERFATCRRHPQGATLADMAKRRRKPLYDDTPRGDPPELPPPERAPRRPRRSVFEVIPWPTWIVVAAVGTVLLTDWGRRLVGLPPRRETVIDLGQGNAVPANKPPVLGSATSPVASPPSKPPTPTIGQLLVAETTVGGAIDAVREHMIDTVDNWSKVNLALGYWLGMTMTIQDVEAIERTTIKQALKNPSASRGTVICGSGIIAEIHEESATSEGGMVIEGEVLRFVAGRSSAGLVKDGWARFCGVFTGLYSYTSVSGTTIHAVQAAGFFDLPDNRKKPPGAPKPGVPRGP